MQNINVKEEFANWLKTSNYDGPINITAKFYVKEDQVSKFCEIMKTVVEYSNTDHAALMYKMYVDYKDPSVFWFIEEWKSVDDLKKHIMDEKHVKDYKLISELLRAPTHIALYKPLD